MTIEKEEAVPQAGPPTWIQAGSYYKVSRHQDVVDVCMNPKLFSSNLVAFVLQGAELSTEIIEIPEGIPRPKDVLAIADEPDHSHQRKRMNPSFNGKSLESYRPIVEKLCSELGAEFLNTGRTEWMSQFATSLPLRVIIDILGLPVDDFSRLQTWSDAGVRIVDGTATGDEFMTLAQKVLEFQAYLAQALNAATESPGTTLLAKLAAMIHAGEMEHDEAVSILLQLVVAGSDSTASLIGSIAYHLASNNHQQEELRHSPDLRTAFIEEVLRFDSPFQGHFRVLTEDTQVGSVDMKKGTRLMLHWGEANRDKEVFACPNSIQPERSELRKHLGFGYGIHRCIGAGLARLEARMALDLLLDHMTAVSLKSNTVPQHRPCTFTRRLETLHLEFGLPA